MPNYLVIILIIVLLSGFGVGQQLIPDSRAIENEQPSSQTQVSVQPSQNPCQSLTECEVFTSTSNAKYLKYLLIFGGIFVFFCGILLTIIDPEDATPYTSYTTPSGVGVCSMDLIIPRIQDDLKIENESKSDSEVSSPQTSKKSSKKPKRKSRARSSHI